MKKQRLTYDNRKSLNIPTAQSCLWETLYIFSSDIIGVIAQYAEELRAGTTWKLGPHILDVSTEIDGKPLLLIRDPDQNIHIRDLDTVLYQLPASPCHTQFCCGENGRIWYLSANKIINLHNDNQQIPGKGCSRVFECIKEFGNQLYVLRTNFCDIYDATTGSLKFHVYLRSIMRKFAVNSKYIAFAQCHTKYHNIEFHSGTKWRHDFTLDPMLADEEMILDLGLNEEYLFILTSKRLIQIRDRVQVGEISVPPSCWKMAVHDHDIWIQNHASLMHYSY